MKLFVGQVKTNRDFMRDGTIQVASIDRGIVTVIYTSTFGSDYTPGDGKSGFFAIPGVDTWILFAEADTAPYDYFYISTIHQPPTSYYTQDGVKKKYVDEHAGFSKETYNQEAIPDRITLMDREGNKVRLNHSRDKAAKKILCGVELKSRDKKKLLLSDSPGAYGIYLLNELDDGITIGSGQKDNHTAGPQIAPRHIDISTHGKITITSKRSSIDMICQNGQDVNIRAESVGLFNLISLGILGSPIGVDPTEPYGNVRVSSSIRDVYITAGDGNKKLQDKFGNSLWSPTTHKSKINLTAYGGESSVQIMSDGSIIIKATNDKIFIHADSINIKGEDSVNIQSKGDLNLVAGGVLKMTGNVSDTTRPTSFDSLEAEKDYDSAQSGIVDSPASTGNGHIELSTSVTINGNAINLAPTTPPVRARKADHPRWELSDYEIE